MLNYSLEIMLLFCQNASYTTTEETVKLKHGKVGEQTSEQTYLLHYRLVVGFKGVSGS